MPSQKKKDEEESSNNTSNIAGLVAVASAIGFGIVSLFSSVAVVGRAQANPESKCKFYIASKSNGDGKIQSVELPTFLDSDLDDLVVHISIESVWLHHGAFSAPVSLIASPTGNSVTHWYCIIQTNKGLVYTLQFGMDPGEAYLTMHQCKDISVARRAGSSFREGKSITIKAAGSPKDSTTTVRDVKKWADAQDTDYSILGNNCQRFGNNLSKHFLDQDATWGNCGFVTS